VTGDSIFKCRGTRTRLSPLFLPQIVEPPLLTFARPVTREKIYSQPLFFFSSLAFRLSNATVLRLLFRNAIDTALVVWSRLPFTLRCIRDHAVREMHATIPRHQVSRGSEMQGATCLMRSLRRDPRYPPTGREYCPAHPSRSSDFAQEFLPIIFTALYPPWAL
jgi:hypothetical protein